MTVSVMNSEEYETSALDLSALPGRILRAFREVLRSYSCTSRKAPGCSYLEFHPQMLRILQTSSASRVVVFFRCVMYVTHSEIPRVHKYATTTDACSLTPGDVRLVMLSQNDTHETINPHCIKTSFSRTRFDKLSTHAAARDFPENGRYSMFSETELNKLQK